MLEGLNLFTAFTVTSYFEPGYHNAILLWLLRILHRLFSIERNVQVSDTTGAAIFDAAGKQIILKELITLSGGYRSRTDDPLRARQML